jgi:hypothetical protein
MEQKTSLLTKHTADAIKEWMAEREAAFQSKIFIS